MQTTEDLETYNEETPHNMWVDFDNFENTGAPAVFDEDSFDDYINNLNDWD